MPAPDSTTTSSPRSLSEAWPALAGLGAVFLFEMLDNSILNVALPTIGRDLDASTSSLQWVNSAYSVVFGGLMIAFSAVADRVGRRKIMLVGLVLLGLSSLATLAVQNIEQLIVVRTAMGVAAAMTTPGSLALAFRLFTTDELRVRAMTVISTVGLVGLAIAPIVGGLVLSVAPWHALLVVNAPIAAIAFLCIRLGIPADRAEELHSAPIDVVGALLGTATIVLALITPTMFVEQGTSAWLPWATAVATIIAGRLFVVRQHRAAPPLLDVALVARPLVSSGLAFKSAAGLATAGLSYLITLQLQLDWGWSPAQAAIGMLPQVVVLIAGGSLIGPLVKRIGLEHAARVSSIAVVLGLAIYAALGEQGYPWIAVSLILVAAGMRVVGVVAGTNVVQGLPADRTTIGAALVDTASELTTGIGIALSGVILTALFTGSITVHTWTTTQAHEFRTATTVAATTITALAAALVTYGIIRSRSGRRSLTTADA